MRSEKEIIERMNEFWKFIGNEKSDLINMIAKDKINLLKWVLEIEEED
jgi:hypothetical protein